MKVWHSGLGVKGSSLRIQGLRICVVEEFGNDSSGLKVWGLGFGRIWVQVLVFKAPGLGFGVRC